MTGFVDIHQHLLYGIDDGPANALDMGQMLMQAYEDGISTIIATPHIAPGVKPFDPQTLLFRLKEARSFCEQKRLDIAVYLGGEILFTPHTVRYLKERRLPTLAGTRHVLVEFAPDIPFEDLREAVRALLRAGVLPVLAHVERYHCLTHRIQNAHELKQDYQVCFQVNCSSVLEKKGFWESRFVRGLLEEEMVDFVATDAHNTSSRPVRMGEAYRVLEEKCGAGYARRVLGEGAGVLWGRG